MKRAVRLGPALPLSIADVRDVAHGQATVLLNDGLPALLASRCEQLLQAGEDGLRVYGLNTGFGPLADRNIRSDGHSAAALQRSLIAHLGTGVGPDLDAASARAVILVRASTLARGRSAVHPELLEHMVACLNAGLAPRLPMLGSVGASGDLTPLAHLAHALVGEGEWSEVQGWEPAAQVFTRHGLCPPSLRGRDGLALVNGTSFSTALAAMASAQFDALLEHASVHAVAYAECLGGRQEAFHPLPAQLRPHPGQRAVQARLARMASSSQRLLEAPGTSPGAAHEGQMPQDAYTLRCAQQILGALHDVARQHREVVEIELGSVTDNPLMDFPDDDPLEVVHAGNFMGLHVGLALDHLHNAIVALAALAERRINRLTHPLLNGALPPFLAGSKPGRASGFMGAQVSASALVAEMRTRSVPAAIQSIPTNGDNQDFVPMTPNAARRTLESLERLAEVLAIEALALAQAVDLMGGPTDGFCEATRSLHQHVRQHSSRLQEDRPLAPDIRALSEAMRGQPPLPSS